MRSDLSAILDDLSAPEVKELETALEYKKTRVADVYTFAEERLWKALLYAVRGKGRIPTQSLHTFLTNPKRGYGRDKYNEALDAIEAVRKQGCRPSVKLSTVQDQILLEIMMESLVALLYSWDRVISLEAVLNSTNLLHKAVDSNYPGYIEARFLQGIVRLRNFRK